MSTTCPHRTSRSRRSPVILGRSYHQARVAELADAPDLGSGVHGRRGSSPLSRTNIGQSCSPASPRVPAHLHTPRYRRPRAATWVGNRRIRRSRSLGGGGGRCDPTLIPQASPIEQLISGTVATGPASPL